MANKAEDLNEGNLFKRPRQIKWREVKKIVELTGPGVPPEHQGLLLIITPDCGQIRLKKEDYVTIKTDGDE